MFGILIFAFILFPSVLCTSIALIYDVGKISFKSFDIINTIIDKYKSNNNTYTIDSDITDEEITSEEITSEDVTIERDCGENINYNCNKYFKLPKYLTSIDNETICGESNGVIGNTDSCRETKKQINYPKKQPNNLCVW